MRNIINGRAAYTGAIRRGTFAARHTRTANTIVKTRRQFVLTRIDEYALALIDEVAHKWRISRGDAIARFVRTVKNATETGVYA